MGNSKQQGISLIEIMIAMIITAIGLLGVAGLQATAMRSAYLAEGRTNAVIAVNNLSERIRANAYELSDNDKKTLIDEYVTSESKVGDLGKANCVSSTKKCTHVALAKQDLLEWGTSTNQIFGVNRDANLTVSSVKDGELYFITITLSWTDYRGKANSNGDAKTVSYQTRIKV